MKKCSYLVSMLATMLAVMIMATASVLANPMDAVNWDNSTITVTGMGVAPSNARNAAQARMLARRAAVVDAYRQLAETVKGVNVESETTVEDFMVASDVTKTKVDAVVKGARIIDERVVADGGYEVTMSISMFGVSNSLASAVMPSDTVKESFPKPTKVAPSMPAYDSSASVDVRISVTQSQPTTPAKNNKAIGGYTGLVIDCRGLNLKPVLSPVVKNADGEKIYGHKNIDPDYVIEHGMVSYTTNVNNVARAGSNPLVVKAIGVQDHYGSPVVSVADANRILIENRVGGFLEKTNVVFIRD